MKRVSVCSSIILCVCVCVSFKKIKEGRGAAGSIKPLTRNVFRLHLVTVNNHVCMLQCVRALRLQ